MRGLPPGRGLPGLSGDAVFRAAASLALAFMLWAWVTTQRFVVNTTVGGPAATEIKGHVLNLATMLAHWQLNQQCDDTGQGQPSEELTAV